MLPRGLSVSLDLDRVPILPVFKWLATSGDVSEQEMLRTFNCGVGMVAVVDANAATAAIEEFTRNGEIAVRLGEVIATNGNTRVEFRGHLDLSSSNA